MLNVNFADDWIQTEDFWCRKQLHNHCPLPTQDVTATFSSILAKKNWIFLFLFVHSFLILHWVDVNSYTLPTFNFVGGVIATIRHAITQAIAIWHFHQLC